MITKKIKIELLEEHCRPEHKFNCIELKSRAYHNPDDRQSVLIGLGIKVKLPKWYCAKMIPHFSTFKKWNIIMIPHSSIPSYIMQAHVEEIDADYDGEWMFSAFRIQSAKRTYLGDTERCTGYRIDIDSDTVAIKPGDIICQAQVRLRSDAPVYMKILDMFTELKTVYVDKIHTDGESLENTGTS
jgi:dUTPase